MLPHTGGSLYLSQLQQKPGHSVCETERRQTRWPSGTDIKRGRKTRGKGDSEGSGQFCYFGTRVKGAVLGHNTNPLTSREPE